MKKVAHALVICVVLLAGAPGRPAHAGTVTSSEIIRAGTNFACMAWRLSGVCFFLRCNGFYCSIETSIQVSHFSPDLVVTSYNTLGESPWTEIRGRYGAAQVAANRAQYAVQGIDPLVGPAGGNFTEPEPNETGHKNAIFKDSEVVGSPGNMATIAASLGLPLFCPMTAVAPVFPYYLSGLDTLAWRSALTEIIYLATWVPGLREVGNFPFNTWGSVHPRNGFIHQTEDPKAGAVIAQRAADVATRTAQPHVYVPVGSVPGWPSGGKKMWEPGPVLENDPKNSKWQMLVPETSQRCEAFGENDTSNVFTGWSANKVDESADYAWNLWRYYQCCDDEGIFLFVVEF